VAGFAEGVSPTARQVAFQIAPRINAAGRMDTAKAVVEMFLTNDAARAKALAQQLHDHNTERQQTEAEVREICESVEVDEAACALVYYGETWHRGVLGIVASRLVERFYRPTFVLAKNEADGLASGSGRSIPAFHLLEALESMSDLFEKFGGHEHAAGVTLDPARVGEFRARFNACAASRLCAEDLQPPLAIDAVLDLRELDDRAVDDVFALAPFGHGNEPPLFAAVNVEIPCPPAVWKEKHLKVLVKQDRRTLSLKAWNFAERIAELPVGARVDIAFSLEEDPYSAARGYSNWCAVLRDVRAAAVGASA
jgi:single-stranded-DNA-specific exonuclease